MNDLKYKNIIWKYSSCEAILKPVAILKIHLNIKSNSLYKQNFEL